jgi:hypothetical protein
MPSLPMVQYWPALKANPSGFSIHISHRSGVMSSRLKILDSARLTRFRGMLVDNFESPPVFAVPFSAEPDAS